MSHESVLESAAFQAEAFGASDQDRSDTILKICGLLHEYGIFWSVVRGVQWYQMIVDTVLCRLVYMEWVLCQFCAVVYLVSAGGFTQMNHLRRRSSTGQFWQGCWQATMFMAPLNFSWMLQFVLTKRTTVSPVHPFMFLSSFPTTREINTKWDGFTLVSLALWGIEGMKSRSPEMTCFVAGTKRLALF